MFVLVNALLTMHVFYADTNVFEIKRILSTWGKTSGAVRPYIKA